MRIITAQEGEKTESGADIHDGPAQLLSNIILKCEIQEKLMDLDAQNAKHQIGGAKRTDKGQSHEIRRIIFDLRPICWMI